MPLRLVVGPPNSGRAGRLLKGFRDSLGRDPVLVVPTADDVERFERELTEGGTHAILRGAILTFSGLVRQLAQDHEVPTGNSPGAPVLAWIARDVLQELREAGDIPTISASSRRPGFAPALVRTFDELEATSLLPEDFEAALHGSDTATPAEREIALVYGRWSNARTERLGGDEHAVFREVRARLRNEQENSPWSGRPIYLYGFDDFSGEQRELVASLAETAEVTVSVSFGEDRPALEARARMLTQLAESIPESLVEREDLPDDLDSNSKPLLDHLARNFLSRSAGRKDAKSNSGLHLLASSGVRSEAESVGTEIARLLGSGVEADQIAIVLRNPARNGIEWRETLQGMGLPVALEASVPVLATNTGRAIYLLGLITSGDAEPAALIEYLRIPGRAFGRDVDRLEREVIQQPIADLGQAIARWREIAPDSRATRDIERLSEAGTPQNLLAATANLATAISQDPIRGEKVIATGRQALELRSGGEIARSMDELAGISPVGLEPSDLGELLQSVSVRTHRGPAHGLVRIASPYRFRAQRVEHLFVASLQDDEFPSRSTPAQLLSDSVRLEVGLPDRSEPIVEERYLFSACLSRPTQGLWLSWRSTDAEGKEISPSPFLDDIRDLVSPVRTEEDREKGEDPLFERIGTRRGLDQVVIELDAAISDTELLRSLASRGRSEAEPTLSHLGMEEERRQSLAARLDLAVGVTDQRVLQPQDIRTPAILEAIGNRGAYGVTTLEEYLKCPYRWFIGHELRPDELERRDGDSSMGTIAHTVLQRLFEMEPGGPLRVIDPESGKAVPGDSVSAWIEAIDPLIDEAFSEENLADGDFEREAKLIAMRRSLKAFVQEEADRSSTFLPDPAMLEVEFGMEGSEHSAPALELDGLSVKGKIDRVDIDRGAGENHGRGIVVDYKYSGSSSHQTTALNLTNESKLQAQLYALALERCFGIDPAGSYYLALGIRPGEDGKAYRPRGVFDREINGSFPDGDDGLKEVFFLEDSLPHGAKDTTFSEIIASAKGISEEIALGIKEGVVDRDPNQGKCPRYCNWQGICRIETRFGDDGE